MIKRLLLPALFVLAMLCCHGQTRRPSLSLSAGAALPIGEFAKKEMDDDASGFAKAGPSLRLTARFPSNNRFGIAASLFTQLNPLDIKAMAEQFNSTTFYRPGMFAWDGSSPLPTIPATTTQFRNWHFEKERWFMAGLMAGVYGNYPLNDNKTVFTASLLTGATYVSSPELDGSSTESTQAATIQQESGHGIGFTSSATIGVVRQLSKRFSWRASISYLTIPSVRFKDITATFTTMTMDSGGGVVTATQITGTGDVKQKISTIDISAGIVLRL